MDDILSRTDTKFLLYAHFPNKHKFEFESEKLIFQVLFVCADGRFEYSVDGIESGVAEKGDAIFCPEGRTLHRYVLEPVKLYVLQFSFSENVPEKLLPAGKTHFEDFSRIETDFSAISSSYISFNTIKPCEQHFLLDVWYNVAIQRGLYLHNQLSNSCDEEMLVLKSHILNELGKNLSVKTLANSFGLTPVAFIRRFYKAFGQTPMDYIISHRLKSAAHMLRDTKKSIAEIAFLCGYDNEYYFSNSFKKRYGQSPSAFRISFKI